MPLYEYECDACGHRFEKIQKFSDPLQDTCPKCGGPVHKLMSSPAIQFKGSGFYITDYAKKDGSKDAKAGESDTKDTKDIKGGTSDTKDTKDTKDGKDAKAGTTDTKAAASETKDTKAADTKNAATKST
jgi:putative FmdB family regulatory protein